MCIKCTFFFLFLSFSSSSSSFSPFSLFSTYLIFLFLSLNSSSSFFFPIHIHPYPHLFIKFSPFLPHFLLHHLLCIIEKVPQSTVLIISLTLPLHLQLHRPHVPCTNSLFCIILDKEQHAATVGTYIFRRCAAAVE